MTTRLDHPLKRELDIGGRPYTLTISPDALLLVPKGRRKGLVLDWIDLVSGDAALATALNASLALAPALERGGDAGATKSRPPKQGRTLGKAPVKKTRSRTR